MSRGYEKDPIIFLNPPKSMPVLPPIEASAIPITVVGILIKSMPRIKPEAANPPISVITPPPKLIKIEFLSALPLIRDCQINSQVCKVLFFSPLLILISLKAGTKDLIKGRQCFTVFSSAKTNTEVYECVLKNWDRAFNPNFTGAIILKGRSYSKKSSCN